MLWLLTFALTLDVVLCDIRIIGGQYATMGQFPHQVSLQRRERHHCGGSIISESVIITAAHCVYGVSPLEIKVLAGIIDLNAPNPEVSTVKQFIIHPNYNPRTQDFDMALIMLNAPFKFNDKIQAIEMVEKDANFQADTIGLVSGFGAVNQQLQLSNRLKYAQVQLWSRDFCNPHNVPGVTDRMICAGHPSGQVSSCQGDSGGPLTVDKKLVGLVSWGFGCGIQGKPAMYTYVAAFRPWIKENAGI